VTDIEDYAAGRDAREEQRMTRSDKTWTTFLVLASLSCAAFWFSIGFAVGRWSV
jgi:hypothetical protein